MIIINILRNYYRWVLFSIVCPRPPLLDFHNPQAITFLHSGNIVVLNTRGNVLFRVLPNFHERLHYSLLQREKVFWFPWEHTSGKKMFFLLACLNILPQAIELLFFWVREVQLWVHAFLLDACFQIDPNVASTNLRWLKTVSKEFYTWGWGPL